MTSIMLSVAVCAWLAIAIDRHVGVDQGRWDEKTEMHEVTDNIDANPDKLKRTINIIYSRALEDEEWAPVAVKLPETSTGMLCIRWMTAMRNMSENTVDGAIIGPPSDKAACGACKGRACRTLCPPTTSTEQTRHTHNPRQAALSPLYRDSLATTNSKPLSPSRGVYSQLLDLHVEFLAII
jgi:hypothetical protein